MGLFSSKSYDILKEELDLLKRATPPLEGVLPPTRLNTSQRITPDQTQSLSIIFRAIQLHQTAAKQCTTYGVNTKKNERVPYSDLPSIVRKPVTKYSFKEYVSRTVSSLIRHGNAYRLKDFDAKGKLVGLIPLNTSDVLVEIHPKNPTQILSYTYLGTRYAPDQISHLKYVEIDEHPVGLSPFEAANIELKGIYDTRNYTRRWLQENSIPLEGYLKSLYDVDDEEAKNLKAAWREGTQGTEGIAVLPQGVDFEPLYLKPSDLQWVEVQKFDAIQQCRLLAAPASIMLIGLEGNSQTYQNVEQDWIGYTRYGLMSLLLPIEEELTELAPANTIVKFNTDALLRTDTLTRYQAHAIALGGKPFLTQEEVRHIEDRDSVNLDQLNPTATDSSSSVEEYLARIIKAKADAGSLEGGTSG